MIILDNAMLARFRDKRQCEICQRRVPVCEPHHLLRKGIGGGRQQDTAINLVSVGSSFLINCQDMCICHRKIHDGNANEEKVLKIVADREKTSVVAILEVRLWIRHLPRDPYPTLFRNAARDLSGEGVRLARETFLEWPGAESWYAEVLGEKLEE